MTSMRVILPASCLAFHKVQDSFIVDYKDIILRELTPNKNYTFQFGPYYVYGGEGLLSDAPAKQKGRWSVESCLPCLINWSRRVECGTFRVA